MRARAARAASRARNSLRVHRSDDANTSDELSISPSLACRLFAGRTTPAAHCAGAIAPLDFCPPHSVFYRFSPLLVRPQHRPLVVAVALLSS